MKLGIIQILCAISFLIFILLALKLKYKNSSQYADVEFLASIVFVSFLINIFKNYIINNYLGLSYPLNTFLFKPSDRFNDFFYMIRACMDNNPYQTEYFIRSSYFPVANSVFYFFSFFGIGYFSYMVYILIFLITYYLFLRSIFNERINFELFPVLIILMFLTYPFLFNLDRGNLEMYVFIFVVCFFYFYAKGKTKLSVFFLAIAISMKLFPGVFIVLLIKDKKYKAVMLTILFVVIFTILSFSSFRGGIMANIKAFLFNLGNFNQVFSSIGGLQHNVSIYGAIKVVTYAIMIVFHGEVIHGVFTGLYPWYVFTVMLLFVLFCSYIIFFEYSKWKNVTILTIIMIIFPGVSFDYRLIFIMIPLSFFFKEAKETRFKTTYLLLFALLLVPHNYRYLYADVSIAVLIYPAIMLLIIGLIIFEGVYPNLLGVNFSRKMKT